MKAATDKLSLMLRAVADPTRRKILRLLQPANPRKSQPKADPEGCTVTHIGQRIKLAQPTISHHMKILKNAGLVETTKEGTWVRYSRVESAIRALRAGLLEEL